ncbi:MAG: FAD-dependent oxidoreductase [Anaerolineae bacterium]|nr:FAD-dependent oxidoreductase [Anaerolineae bacterium]
MGAAAIPVLGQVDVLVVGGGTSGAAAAITAAREGVRTAVVDMNPGLGGTGTYGGVHSYWFGQRTGAVARIMGLVDRMHQRLGLPTQAGQIPSWNIEAKGWALLQEAEEAGAEVLLNALAWGTVVEDAVVRGAVVATRTGPVALLARVLIDATGDADLAAFAGAECVYGAERDHVTMWYSLPQFREPGITRNNFASMVDVGNIEDYTRAILAGRRRGAATDHDHGVYVAPRESRHLHAEAVVTLTDQLLRRAWPDVVYIAYSNSDIKGHSTSDWVRMGLISPNLEVEVPYRALLPRGLDNLIVAGKAFGATHDALPAMRMQPDLENLGAVAALAAVEAVRSGAPPRYTAAARLQQRLVAEGLLPARVLRRTLRPMRLSDAELARQIASLSAARPLSAYSDMEIGEVYRGRIPFVDVLCAGPRAVPMLEEALRPARGRRRVLLAQGLAALGSRAGVPVLIEAIERELASGRLPERRTEIRHANEPPDQGAMPEAAYLLYSLGMARDRRALPVWQRVVDLLAHVTADDLHDRAAATLAERSASRKGIFYYVDSVCFGAERLGDPEAIPILSRLHSYPLFHGQVLTSGFQAEVLHERLAYLELAIGRALGRSGSPEGLLILIDYLADVRALLAEHAHSELVAISACDHGKDLAAWGQWLEAVGDSLKPSPIAAPTDPVRAWTESVLLERRGFERTPRPGCRLHGT